MLDRLNPFEDLAEEGEFDMMGDLYGEEGEMEMDDEEGEMEQEQPAIEELHKSENQEQEKLGTFDLKDDDKHSSDKSID